MKKKVLLLLVACSTMLCQPVMAMDQNNCSVTSVIQNKGVMPFASDYIGSYDGVLEHAGDGVLVLNGYVDGLGTDKMEIVAQVQIYSNGRWVNKGTVLKESSPGLAVAMNRERIVTSGTYRVKYTFNAYVGSKIVESRSYTTSSVIVIR